MSKSSIFRKIIANEKAQALVEFFLFLPFLMIMYTVIMSLGNAINASINQQKATRNYYFYRTQNDSNVPSRRNPNYTSWQLFGMSIMGWAERLEGGGTGNPISTCYKLRIPLGSSEEDSCDESYSGSTTQFIRVSTVFGLCGATYSNTEGRPMRLPGASDQSAAAFSGSGCLVR